MNMKPTTFIAAAFLTGALSASAFALPAAVNSPAWVPPAVAEVQLAQDMQRNRMIRPKYERRLHGDRCRTRSAGCRYQRNGWYYNDRWWLGPAIIGGAIIGSQLGDRDDDYNDDYYDNRRYNRRHVNWCSDRYQSYNSRNNTWLSYSGRYRQCISPYS